MIANAQSFSYRLQRLQRPWLRAVATVLLACCATSGAAEQTAAIASAHPLASAAGYDTLRRGGNAFDAAIAVAAVLAVVEPYSSGLGGGGFFLLHRAADGRQVMVDARETAPTGATRDHYFDRDGNPISGASTQGGTAAAIPGLPAALVHLARHYGRQPLGGTLAAAIRHARDGFEVDQRFARVARQRERFLQNGINTANTFLDGNRAPQPGFVLRQPALADTLAHLARDGRSGFYAGPVARSLVEAANAAGGQWHAADLDLYKVIEREPVRFTYRGATITAAALPSAGGIALAQSLGMLGQFRLSSAAQADTAADTAHLVIEVLRRVFQDRARLGDGDFVAVPVENLIAGDYARQHAATINPERATKSDDLHGEQLARAESGNTTHFSVIDAEGNRVAATLSINGLFGAGIVAGDTGVLLNNEMDDFTLRSDVPNSYRLRGGVANAIAPGKRPLSSMTPTFVEDDKGVLILGAPGGSRIISQVLLGVLDYLHSPTVDLQRLVAMSRYHHQYWPDRVEIEPEGFTQEWQAALAAKGHEIHVVSRKWGNMQAVFRSKQTGEAQAASDPRGADVAWY